MLGHVDHGKTTLLDRIRGTAVASGEPGLITQYISASFIPTEVIKKTCGHMLKQLKTELTIPGLLWIDSPGHEAFTTLRKRGGAIADLAVLVVDINEGFKPQTEESLNYLKQFKTPFVVALTKIDRVPGWNPQVGRCFLESMDEQTERAKNELDDKLYRVVGQLSARGFEAERYDRVKDYSKQVAVVPVSGRTGEGVPDLLMILAGIAQRYLKKGLETAEGEGKGTVLEVKEFRGLGTTIDVILYDGEIRRGDYLVIGSRGIVKTRAKALLEPNPLKELRLEKDFRNLDSVHAAAGIKIAAPGLEGVVAGSPLRSVREEKDMEKAVGEVRQEIEEVEFEVQSEGIILKADTLGSLEALIKTLKDINVKIRKAAVGDVTKSDIMEAKTMEDPMVFAFGVKISQEIEKLAKDNKVAVFSSDIIYHLIEDYGRWVKDRSRREEERLLESVTHPGKIRVLRGYVFRQSRPAVFGVEVIKGTINPGCRLEIKGKVIGEIKEMQSKGESVKQAVTGDRVALSIDGVIIGKDIREGDELRSHLTEDDIQKLEKLKSKLRPDERELLEERANE
jgi:translation initiation factor 5B